MEWGGTLTERLIGALTPVRRKYSEGNYMFCAARLACALGGLAGAEKLDPLADAPSFTEAAERLAELGITPVRDAGGINVEATLTEFTAAKYAELEEYCPDSELVDISRLRYDCHNVKTVIKCRALKTDAAKYVIDCGTVPAARIISAAEKFTEGAFAFLSPNMAAAADRALRELDATGSARVVDVLLDAACFADMRAYADAVGFDPVCRLVRMKIDLTNIVTALRLLRIRDSDTAAALMKDSFIEGGSIPVTALCAVKKPESVAMLAEEAGYASLALAVRTRRADASGLELIAAAADSAFLAETERLTHFRQLGAYPLVDYVIRLEYEIKNLRIILSGKVTGADAQTIRERLRRA